MLKNNRNEREESGKIFALTIGLTNFLLLMIVGGVFWLVQIILTQHNRLNEITGRFNFH